MEKAEVPGPKPDPKSPKPPRLTEVLGFLLRSIGFR